ncbi:MAG: hypothetical protein WBP61_07685 [Nocardioides sp.]
MTVEQTPAPARSDVRRPTPAPPAPTRPFVRRGLLLTAGAAAWAAAIAVIGVDPGERTGDLIAYGVGSGLFQLGLLGLLTVLWQTRALGEGRLARFFLRVEVVLVTLALASTTVDALGVSDLDRLGWILLDACWPLSMLGMFLIGIRIAVHGKWRGVSRWWPMVAESWALVVIPTLNIAGETAAGVVAALHLLVGYAVLGVIVALKRA